MDCASPETGHVLLFAYSFYGHQKPMCDLAVRIVRSRRLYGTILVGDKLLDTIRQQVSSQFRMENEKDLTSLIRVIGIDCGVSGFDSETTICSFASAFNNLAREQPLSLSRDTVQHDADKFIPPPALVILDLLGYEALKIIRRIGGLGVRVLVLQTSMAAQVFLMSAPKELGGRDDFSAELQKEAKHVGLDGKGIAEFAQQLWERTSGKPIGVAAGLPQMHDYEVYPQESVFGKNLSIAYMVRHMHKLFSECDHIRRSILNTKLFLHGGRGSVLGRYVVWEGVPMICWPFRGDQPCNAVNLTMNLNVAYELFEVGNGVHGLSPLLRLGGKAPSGDLASVHREDHRGSEKGGRRAEEAKHSSH